MGGINCPPGQILTDDVTYQQDLAAYCESLFGGVAAFWGGHQLIERAIVDNDSATPTVVNAFVEAQEQLVEARNRFGAFIATHASGGIEPDEFIGSITEAIDGVEKAVLELGLLTFGESGVQIAIWESGITEAMVSAATAINRVTALQMQFALATKRQLATTAA